MSADSKNNKGWGSWVIGSVFIILCVGFVYYAVRPNCNSEIENTLLPSTSKNGTSWEKKAHEAEKKAKQFEAENLKLQLDIEALQDKLSEAASAPVQTQNTATGGGDYLPVVKQGCQTEAMKYSKADRLKYVSSGSSVPGYMYHPIPYITAVISQYQHSLGICGDVGEIGVHRGLYGIAVCHTMTKSEKYLAADIYDLDIGVNTAGDFFRQNTVEAMTANLHNFGIKPEDYVIKRADSTTLNVSDIMNDKIGPFRLFSVDGGHSAEVLLSDMVLVSQAMVEGGIVVMDDYDAPGWEGIREGFAKYWNVFKARDIPLAPVFFSSNKMFATTPKYYQKYYDFIVNHPVLKNWISYEPHGYHMSKGIEGPWKFIWLMSTTSYQASSWTDLINSME